VKKYLWKKKQMEEKIANFKKIRITNKPFLFVEDKYDKIYKVAWLKLNNIVFDYDNVDIIFQDTCRFMIDTQE
jgi:hypothetical protein